MFKFKASVRREMSPNKKTKQIIKEQSLLLAACRRGNNRGLHQASGLLGKNVVKFYNIMYCTAVICSTGTGVQVGTRVGVCAHCTHMTLYGIHTYIHTYMCTCTHVVQRDLGTFDGAK